MFPIHDKQALQQACATILLRKDKVTTAEELDQFMKKEKGKYPDSFLATRHVPKTYLFFDSFPLIIMSDFRPVTTRQRFDFMNPTSSDLYQPVLS
jgi:hypothetical protein